MEMQGFDPNSGIAEEYYSLKFNTKEKWASTSVQHSLGMW
jgi:hypothetical protein